jgi:NAD-dependent SIR2 family protein deacetylase
MVLTGAGISKCCPVCAFDTADPTDFHPGVSSGVPDFRSPDGIYAKIKASGQYEDLDDPQQM